MSTQKNVTERWPISRRFSYLQQRTGQISSAAVRSLLNAITIQFLSAVDERSDSIAHHSMH
jgi:hypothetical protein